MDQIVEVLRGDGIVCASHLVMRGDEMMVTMMITRIEAWGGLQDMVWRYRGILKILPNALLQEPAGKWLSECIYGELEAG